MMMDKLEYPLFVLLRLLTCKDTDVAGDLTAAAITVIGTAVIKISLAVSLIITDPVVCI